MAASTLIAYDAHTCLNNQRNQCARIVFGASVEAVSKSLFVLGYLDDVQVTSKIEGTQAIVPLNAIGPEVAQAASEGLAHAVALIIATKCVY